MRERLRTRLRRLSGILPAGGALPRVPADKCLESRASPQGPDSIRPLDWFPRLGLIICLSSRAGVSSRSFRRLEMLALLLLILLYVFFRSLILSAVVISCVEVTCRMCCEVLGKEGRLLDKGKEKIGKESKTWVVRCLIFMYFLPCLMRKVVPRTFPFPPLLLG